MIYFFRPEQLFFCSNSAGNNHDISRNIIIEHFSVICLQSFFFVFVKSNVASVTLWATVNRRSTTQCNATSRIRYTVLFGINVQDTIKYLPFDMSGTVAESVTDATLLFTKTRKKFCKHITEKRSI